MAHSYLAYTRLKAVISALRYLDGEKPAPAQPDEVFTITGRDGKREIKVHVYRPESPTTPTPVLINFNGADEAFCRHVARHTSFTVLDASYALAPEDPFPAAVEDAQDVVAHVRARPGEYDVGRVVLCGFSSGGNLALAASQGAAGAGGEVRGVVAFYPPTEMRTHPAEKRMLAGRAGAVPGVRSAVMGMLREAYLSGGEAEAGDARVSVDRAPEGAFPEDVVVITAEGDRLAAEGERFAAGIGGGGRRVVLKRCEGVGHGFDKMEGEEEGRAREEAYGVVVEFLRGVVGEGGGGC
ncbi:hypothetical protein GCG54_00005140 [Colletotrichum gloeosporioides]|uniref:Alpha/beta hydrolase fold-3 domain-containing protein n=1 Tax=Colletotrichum gloeosporioides TaxID=474922 RepID=A0A8H4FKZ3_COLGL|nr:uncharacterized protein GCG54_00005140 [Colletotrichum gloeosporioides]KAF3805776.1 hypothetical protein GCG54_00005140 [Colletotrichum gloeosporioides]